MRVRSWCVVWLVILLVQASWSWAGQVVTDETREWARKALEEEGSLKAVPDANTLAVLYFINRTGNRELDPIQKGFAIMLITDLSSVKGLQVVERVKLQAIMEELGLGSSGIVEPSSAPRVGRLLAARRLVGGEYTGVEANLAAAATMLALPRAEVLGRGAAEGELAALFRVEKDILFQIIDLLKIGLSPEEETLLRRPCSANSKALDAVFRGVDASDNQQYEKAAALYEMALQLDPFVCIAGDALKELSDLKLVTVRGLAVRHKGVAVREPVQELMQSVRDATSLTNQLVPKEEVRREIKANDVPTTTTINVIFPTGFRAIPPAQGRQR